MHARSITKLYTNVDLLIKHRIEGAGDIVAVDLTMLFADPGDGRKLGGKTASAMRVFSALERKGVEIWQLDGDLRSFKVADRDKMLAVMFASFQRRRYESTKRGRKPVELSPQQRAIIEPIWFNLVKYETNEIAAKAATAALAKAGMPRALSAAILLKRQHLGPSGRSLRKTKPKKR